MRTLMTVVMFTGMDGRDRQDFAMQHVTAELISQCNPVKVYSAHMEVAKLLSMETTLAMRYQFA